LLDDLNLKTLLVEVLRRRQKDLEFTVLFVAKILYYCSMSAVCIPFFVFVINYLKQFLSITVAIGIYTQQSFDNVAVILCISDNLYLMCISDFREQIVFSLLEETIENINPNISEPMNNQPHIITSTEKKERCNNCDLRLLKQCGRQHAVKNCKQVQQHCKSCVGKFMCND